MLNLSPLLFVKDTAFRKTAKFRRSLILKIINPTSLFPFHTASLHPASKLATFDVSSGTCSIFYRLYMIPVEQIYEKLCFMGKQA